MAKTRFLITGGAGFIGINLAADQLRRGSVVTIFDNLSRTGVKQNLQWLKQEFPTGRATIMVGDTRDETAVLNAVKHQNIIFHEAGQTAVTTSLTDPVTDFNVNVMGTVNLLEAVRKTAPEAIVVYASTNKVYGDLGKLEIEDVGERYEPKVLKAIGENQPLDFYSPYGCSKGAADQYIHDYARSYNLRTIVFRQSCIYGVHQMGVEDQGWVAYFALRAIKHQPITIYGTGKQVRDILYIDDLVKAYTQAVDKIVNTRGQAYNIGGGIGNTVSLKEILKQLETELGYALNVKYAPERLGDQKYYVSDNTKAKQDFLWEPETGVKSGLQKLINWLRIKDQD